MPRLTPVAATLAACLVAALPAAAADVVGRSVFADPLTTAGGQHSTAVEPDSFASGQTVVTAFQVGRIQSGGANAIGWASSHDGGRSWRSGLLPGITVAAGGGPNERASDPAVAFDRVHGVWLVSVLALRGTTQLVSSLVTSRSADGLAWSGPVTTAASRPGVFHDKNWIVCDNGERSRFAGRCYTVWSHHTAGVEGAVAVSASTDGGLQWTEPLVLTGDDAVGVQPVVQADGTLVIPYIRSEHLEAVRSTDGGATFERPVFLDDLRYGGPAGMRAPPLPSAEVAGDGRVWIAWPDCRFRRSCPPATASDIVLSSSGDGRSWTRPVRVPFSARTTSLHHVIPGLGVDPATTGARTRLAVTAYTLRGDCSGSTCPIRAETLLSSDAGRTWTQPQLMSAEHQLSAVPLAGGRMVGDYVSTSWSAGNAVPVVTAPVAPFDGRFHHEVLTAVLPPAPAAAASLRVSPARPRPAAAFTARVTLSLTPSDENVTCSARVARTRVLARARTGAGRTATCSWRLPRTSAGRVVAGSVRYGGLARSFALRVRAS